MDSVYCNEQLTCNALKELVAVLKTNDVPMAPLLLVQEEAARRSPVCSDLYRNSLLQEQIQSFKVEINSLSCRSSSSAEISSNVVKVCGFDAKAWGQHVIGGQLQKRTEACFTVGNKVLHKLDNSISQGGLWCFCVSKAKYCFGAAKEHASTNKSLTRF